MSKKDFIALADTLRRLKPTLQDNLPGMELDSASRQWAATIIAIAATCAAANPAFKCDRWLAYINGTGGPNGGKPKA